jgi:pilus assembly protein Flp/PilA
MFEINLYVDFLRHNISRLRATMASEEGASAVEYGLIVSLIAAAIVALVTTLGSRLVVAFTKIVAALPSS